MVSCASWWSLYQAGEISLYSGEVPLVKFSLQALEVIKKLPIKTSVEFPGSQRNSTGQIDLFILEGAKSCSIQSKAPFYEKPVAEKIAQICQDLCFGFVDGAAKTKEEESPLLGSDPMLAQEAPPILEEVLPVEEETKSEPKKAPRKAGKKGRSRKRPKSPRSMLREKIKTLPLDEWPYSCTYCGKKDYRADNMTTHTIRHEPDSSKRIRGRVHRKMKDGYTIFYVRGLRAKGTSD